MTMLAKDISLHLSGFDLLRNISLEVEAGKVTAIVGPNGAGKSSLLKVLTGDIPASKGDVYLNSRLLNQWPLLEKAQMLAVLPQHTLLNFSFTADEVVGLGRIPHQTGIVKDQQIITEALELVDASYLQRRFYTQMSGGEKQRVAIARTILKRPPILVFDEATSSLDSKSERSILSALQEISQGYTSMVIAHRLSTVIDADRIIVLDQGGLVEQGSHSKLLSQKGLYFDLWTAQLRDPN